MTSVNASASRLARGLVVLGAVSTVEGVRILDIPALKAGTDKDQVVSEHEAATQAGEFHQDGYHLVDCINDKMQVSGDKFGEPLKFDAQTPVSIIRYDQVVPKPKQEAMSSALCFDFCRKFQHMKAFGLVRGSECYCSSFFVPTAGKSEGCDMACEGNAAEMCGGQTKASVYEMHDCGRGDEAGYNSTDTALFMASASAVEGSVEAATKCAKNILAAGSALATVGGKVGNKIAQLHHRAMMESQNVIQRAVKNLDIDAAKAASDLKGLVHAYGKAPSGSRGLTPIEKEKLTKEVDAAYNLVAEVTPHVQQVERMCEPLKTPSGHTVVATEETEAAFFLTVAEKEGLLYDVMCDGNVIQPVMEVRSDSECAKMCRETLNPDACVGYQSYVGVLDGSDKVICMLFSSISSAVQYTKNPKDCSEPGAASRKSARCRIPATSEPLQKEIMKTLDNIDGKCFGVL